MWLGIGIMYETEVNQRTEGSDQIPPEVAVLLAESSRTVTGRTVLPWSEHCTECVWPSCYTTCDLYSPREDGRCRRFVDGMVRINCAGTLNSYLLKITFKRWGKLWAPGNVRLRSAESARGVENRDYRIGTALNRLPMPGSIRRLARGKRYSLKKKVAYWTKAGEMEPTSFLVECHNPGAGVVDLSLGIRPVDISKQISFQKLIQLKPGFSRVRVPYAEIANFVDLKQPFNVELIPNGEQTTITLVFGVIDFVHEVPEVRKSEVKEKGPQKVKCVIWDLDNTLWDGILVEDGQEKLVLKPGIADVIQKLDRRGILQSIASKNNHDDAMAVLQRLGLQEMFLAPQISWGAKSEGVREIARQLNIGLDSLLFVDDSEFELAQVAAVIPEVRTMDSRRYTEIPDLEICRVPITDESRERRKMYQVEAERRDLATSYAGDYMAFLRHCDIRLNIRPMSENNLERVHELTQRTNQMNFSGHRYDRDVLRQILRNEALDTYVLEVVDRFGSYGVVGFSIVDKRKPLLTDLMFSCRIQAKRVEHAFLGWAIRKYREERGGAFWANYRKTAKNAPSGQVFSDIGMQETQTVDGVSHLVLQLDQPVPDDNIVTIAVEEPVGVV